MVKTLAIANTLFNDEDKELVDSLLRKIAVARTRNDRMSVVSRREITSILNSAEISQIEKVYSLDPFQFGFKGPKQEIEPVPGKLVRIPPMPYHSKGIGLLTAPQYIPDHTYTVYMRMAKAIYEQLGRTLLIESCYRSNDFQAITFLRILKINNFNIQQTIQRAAIPGYSEHTTPSRLALDLQNVDGFPTDETPQDFQDTLEYKWLGENAELFDFYMSYPKDNPYGLMFEPWHWRRIPS
ncbi:MAG TPA: D-alanyl-D-alanine carboxypeptidase family protein [Candidatus Saccharimonadales bacterium]